MAQKVVGYVRFQVPAGKATPAPPVGPALGQYGPEFSWAAMPDVAKTILAMLMLIGRLDIFGFIIALNPATYRSSWS